MPPLVVCHGSSPRTWGTRRSRFRSCSSPYGSSPRTWGTHFMPLDEQAVVRFIPTHVGNTTANSFCCGVTLVHPHARGEHGSSDGRKPNHFGSSPRTWGTRHQRNDHVGVHTVHPHARGEHVTLAEPLADGQWFIPTHVGNTDLQLWRRVQLLVHPHARGEHFEEPIERLVSNGSSPRTWGTRRANGRGPDCAGFIPTHVGNTIPRRFFMPTSSVHPHARGEHAL